MLAFFAAVIRNYRYMQLVKSNCQDNFPRLFANGFESYWNIYMHSLHECCCML